MLDAPRWLLARAEPPLIPVDAPLNAPRFAAPADADVCRRPTVSPPPRVALMLPVLAPLLPAAEPLAPPRFTVPAWAPPAARA
jgi:hypothetical protein